MMYLVESLARQCQDYILMHVEEFSVCHLSLLPLSMRKDLLYQLPVADICLRLENTDFTVGLDMVAFWKSTWEDEFFNVANPSDSDISGYVQEWDNTEYARAVLYGLVATRAIGHLRGDEYWFHSPQFTKDPNGIPESGMTVFQLLYAIRKPHYHIIVRGGCELIFPPRYSNKSKKQDKDLTMYEVVRCFSHDDNEFPRIFPEIEMMADINLDHVYFFRNAVYIDLRGNPFDEPEFFEFLQALFKEATNLEVLILDHWGEDDEWEPEFFDEFCTYLSSCQSFLSTFRLFKLFSSMCSLGFVVSRKNFNQLTAAYFAAPTNHMQKLEFTYTKIKCYDVSFECMPKIDQRYLPFKTIKLDHTCQFVSEYKPSPQVISRWLGQNITELDSDSVKHVESCFFKVENKAGEPSRKPQYSELDAEDNGDK